MSIVRYILPFILFSQTLVYSQSYKPKKGKRNYFSNSRLQKPIYRWVTGDYSRTGLQFSFGPTYTLTNPKNTLGEYHINNVAGDTLLKYTRDPKSRLGAFVELGMVHITTKPHRFIHYFDWGIGFKYIGGAELTHSQVFMRDTLQANLEGKGEFYNGYLYGRFDVHNVFQMNQYLFLDNSLGVNGDYALIVGNKAYNGYHIAANEKFQGNINVQLHYSLGLGMKPNPRKGFYFIPSIEVPIIGAYEWHGGTPSIYWFSSKYYPIQLRLKFVFLFRKGPHCPAVDSNEQDKKAAEQYQNR